MSIDPEYTVLSALPAQALTPETLGGFRDFVANHFLPKCESMEGVVRKEVSVPGLNGAPNLTVYVYSPEAPSSEPRPAIFYIHGGGTVAGQASMNHITCSNFVKQLGIVAINTNYRLAPEHPYPAAIEDLYASLTWVHATAKELGVDVSNIAVGGASAGGGLAASLALKVRDKKEFKFVFQLLTYPMLDDRTCLKEHRPEVAKYIWTLEHNKFGWQSYLGDVKIGDANVSPYAAASRAQSLEGLPPAFVVVGEYDLFRDEDVEYVQRLWKAGVSAELIVLPGIYHLFDIFLTTEATANFDRRVYQVLRRALLSKK